MDSNDRQAIDELFRKLRDVEGRSPQRDREAEALIRDYIARQPGAPYYMAQAIIAQEQALVAARQRLEEAERRGGGGFLEQIFGGGRREEPPRTGWAEREDVAARRRAGPWGAQPSFLGGAMQTALGVAGGLMIGNFIASLLAPDPAAAADPGHDQGAVDEAQAAEEDVAGGDAGGDDFGGGDFGEV